jgi:hypothetical protein
MRSVYPYLILFLFIAATLNTQKVYITKSGTKYHNSDCKYLSKSKIEIDLKTAKEKAYDACELCFKDSIQEAKSTKTETTKVKDEKVVEQQCKALTQSGKQCSRKASKGSKYCWQHKKKVK